MRIFVHLVGFGSSLTNNFQVLKPQLNSKNKIKDPIARFSVKSISTSDQLIDFITHKFAIKENNLIIKLIIKHRNTYKKILVLQGFDINIYTRIDDEQKSIMSFQLEVQVTIMNGKINKGDLDETSVSSVATEASMKIQDCSPENQIYRLNKVLFDLMGDSRLQQFVDLLLLIKKKYSTSLFKIIINICQEESGYNILHMSILHNKTQFLQHLIKDYSSFIDFNLKTIDGWLPFQLALEKNDKNIISIFFQNAEKLQLDFNCASEEGQVIYNLIDTTNIDLISKIVKHYPIQFEIVHHQLKINAYDYVWKHPKLTEENKKYLISLMHERHLEEFDMYCWDQLLYHTCKKYIPSAPKTASPKKQITYNPNLKIISGQTIRWKKSSILSKYVFFSVNSYIGALEEYEINHKLKLSNDKQKLDLYKKDMHISFEQIQSVKVIDQKQKSWYLKKQWSYFIIHDKKKNKVTFACNHEYTATQWVQEIQQAIDAWHKNEEKHHKICKNYVHISDVQYKPPQVQPVKRIGANKVIDLFSNMSICDTAPSHSKSMEEIKIQKSKSTFQTVPQIPLGQDQASSLKYIDFNITRHLGQGSFGQVFLAECLKNKKSYALKVFQKKKIILSKQTKFVIAEVNILKQINHPFIINLHFTFQTPNYIYLGLQYCQGKDLAKHLNQQMSFNDDEVKLYAAEIILALEYIHSMGVIYRDLKPDNIMLGKDGHILLVDFGLSKKTQNNFAKTFCGSPAYLSPEMLDKHGVGPQSDFFTLGVVVYQFLFGQPPFFSDNIVSLYENIKKSKVKFPRKMDESTKDFLSRLLQKDPTKRLGSKSIEEIKTHAYFNNLDWNKVYNKEYQAPHRELINNEQNDLCAEQKEIVDIFHDDFDYSEENTKINRFKNFSFARQGQFK